MRSKSIKLNVPGFEVGEVYSIELGNYRDKYLVMYASTERAFQLKRVRLPKTKIDGVRLPENIFISYYGTPIKNNKK